MTRRFNKLLSELLQEADSFIPDEEGDEDIDVQEEGGMEGDEEMADEDMADFGGEDDGMGGMMDEAEVASMEEVELAKLAVRALQFDPASTEINYKIYDDFEKKRNLLSILQYVERKIDKQFDASDVNRKYRRNAMDDETKQKDDIVSKILMSSQNKSDGTGLSDSKRLIWGRIILNAFKYDANNYDLSEEDVTPEDVPDLFKRLSVDFNLDTRGDTSGKF